jgi:hypothetical protein
MYAFADPLKELCQDIYCLPHECFYGDDDQKNKVVEEIGVSGRHILQFIGTEVFRNIDEHTWINYLERELQKLSVENLRPIPRILRLLGIKKKMIHAVIQDVRFLNEAEMLLFLRWSCPSIDTSVVYVTGRGGSDDKHASEVEVRKTAAKSTHCIKNNGTLADLENKVKYTLDI